MTVHRERDSFSRRLFFTGKIVSLSKATGKIVSLSLPSLLSFPPFLLPTKTKNKKQMLRALLRITFSNNNSHCKKSKTTTGLSLLHSSSISIPEADEPDLHSQPQRPQNHRKRLIIKDLSVTPDEDGMRLDRFIKYRLAQEPHWATFNNNTISKWLRKRQVKLVLPLSTIADSHTSTDTSNHDSQLLRSGHSLGTKDLLNNSTKTITVTTAATRTVAGQMWRIRTLVDPDLVDKEAAVGAEQIAAFSGTDQVSHPAAVSSTDHLPLKDWIVYEDERIIVLNKPSGIPVQGGTGVTTSIASSLSCKLSCLVISWVQCCTTGLSSIEPE